MRWHSLVLIFAAAGCSPVPPSAMEVQFALERYYLDRHAPRGENSTPLVARCPVIEAFRSHSSTTSRSGNGDAFFRFPASKAGGGKPSAEIHVPLRMSDGRWFIDPKIELNNLPCKIIRVDGVSRPAE